MNWFTAIASYIILWFLALFVVLPIGVRGQAEEDEVEHGSETGAPVDSMIVKKAIWATVLAFVLLGLLYQIVYGGWLTWDRMAQWMRIRD